MGLYKKSTGRNLKKNEGKFLVKISEKLVMINKI